MDKLDLEQLMVDLVASGICFGAATSKAEEEIHSKMAEDVKAEIRALFRRLQSLPQAVAPPAGEGAPVHLLRDVLKKACNLVYDWADHEDKMPPDLAKPFQALEDACIAALPPFSPHPQAGTGAPGVRECWGLSNPPEENHG